MKILIISNMFPPYIMGGAEMAAHSLAQCLSRRGHVIHVLTSANQRQDESIVQLAENLSVERRYFPNIYQVFQAPTPSPIQKAIWHSRDHYNPWTESITTDVIDRFHPDLVNTHNLQGIGYNILRAIGRSGVPCVQTIHDFGLVCINMNRFKDGRECQSLHLPCQISSFVKKSYFSKIKRLSYWSPSQALLDKYQPFLAPHIAARAIPLPLSFNTPKRIDKESGSSKTIRLLYVGQVVPWKGVAFILSILKNLPQKAIFHLDIVGGGESLEALKTEYQGSNWVAFRGKVPPETVSDYMAAADLLLVPSLWFENAPLVISQAIRTGLPVFASKIGGLPEMLEDNLSGRLLDPGDADAWTTALKNLAAEPALLETYRAGTLQLQPRFAIDRLADRVLSLFEETLNPETVLEPA